MPLCCRDPDAREQRRRLFYGGSTGIRASVPVSANQPGLQHLASTVPRTAAGSSMRLLPLGRLVLVVAEVTAVDFQQYQRERARIV